MSKLGNLKDALFSRFNRKPIGPGGIRIIHYETLEHGILGKFVRRLQAELTALGRKADMVKGVGDPSAAIGHHILYSGAQKKWAPIETCMIAHVTEETLEKIRRLLGIYDMGILMSKETRDNLLLLGLPARRLCYIGPAQDGVIKPRPLAVGIASKTYKDGRKDENSIIEAFLSLPAGAFVFKIMGKGWNEQVNRLRRAGHQVVYYRRFNYDQYVSSFMPSLDYFVYHSYDEGSMAFPDALAADVRTIVTPQGFHLDIPGGIDHPIACPADVVPILASAHEQRLTRAARVAGWNWREYAIRHLLVWDYLLTQNSPAWQEEWKEFLRRLRQENLASLAAALDDAALPGPEIYREAINWAAGYGLAAVAAQLERGQQVYYPPSSMNA